MIFFGGELTLSSPHSGEARAGWYASLVGLGRPSSLSGRWGRSSSIRNPLHYPVSTPNDLPPKKAGRWGDKAKPLASLGRRLCCLRVSLRVGRVSNKKAP